MAADSAKLFLVPTPIGNLEDITLRAVRVLREVDLVLAEDTRTTGFLLKHLNIATKLQSHHKFNEHQTVERIAALIATGKSVALVSDAGTPGISDPGFLLVRTCIEKGVDVECLPGATAFVPALITSGLPCDRFCFEGFLPQKKGRQSKVASLQGEERTMIFYESPYRLLKLLQQLSEALGGSRRAAVSRELSKLHEETLRGTLAELALRFTQKEPKGEVVVVVEGC
ncbi:MAG: 16S rRNA (cytidine(1402)-2'-O)-methyltransferase [Prevotellaceae bacterium]|jgi:16S rRNA (cytidine1402-2'-O)-methyltransferase|nr:16S rRNA (cytidine(1402)-2'-O)-methyltransferase [Prevotellaceae bacterium]